MHVVGGVVVVAVVMAAVVVVDGSMDACDLRRGMRGAVRGRADALGDVRHEKCDEGRESEDGPEDAVVTDCARLTSHSNDCTGTAHAWRLAVTTRASGPGHL